ncbi:Chemotaxis response regulator protein-glutamate methylesterase [bacterium HR29]|jgi:two-component system chemotaxis response regulator CheB|nr:Chemotaxis response regulator protein-glutamate methylesterase [bacterium HR29]
MTAAPASVSRPIRVLIVDDSPFMRHAIRRILTAAGGFEVVGTAVDGLDGLRQALALRPDVITMDVEMPRMDGVQAVRELMASLPTPVVMVSTLTRRGAEVTLEALEAGAVDYVTKPSADSQDLYSLAESLTAAVQRAAGARLTRRNGRGTPIPAPASARGAALEPPSEGQPARTLVVIGSSTGGPPALTEVVSHLSPETPAGYIIVQHMPPHFTAALAHRLDSLTPLSVKEAEEGDIIAERRVLVAPGDFHLRVSSDRTVRLEQSPPRHGVRPSVDVTLESAPPVFGRNTVAVVLTGMGRDGAAGARLVEEAGGVVIVQDERTSVIYGMPKAAKEAVTRPVEVPLQAVAQAIDTAVRVGIRR